MINLSLLEDMMRHLGLPTALVAGSIGGGTGRQEPAAPARLARHTPSLLRLGLAQIVAVARSGANRRRVAAIGAPPAETFADLVEDLHRAYVALVTGMFPLSSAIGPPLGILRATGTLFEHASRHRDHHHRTGGPTGGGDAGRVTRRVPGRLRSPGCLRERHRPAPLRGAAGHHPPTGSGGGTGRSTGD